MIPKNGHRFPDQIMRNQGTESLGFSALARLRLPALVNAFEVW